MLYEVNFRHHTTPSGTADGVVKHHIEDSLTLQKMLTAAYPGKTLFLHKGANSTSQASAAGMDLADTVVLKVSGKTNSGEMTHYVAMHGSVELTLGQLLKALGINSNPVITIANPSTALTPSALEDAKRNYKSIVASHAKAGAEVEATTDSVDLSALTLVDALKLHMLRERFFADAQTLANLQENTSGDASTQQELKDEVLERLDDNGGAFDIWKSLGKASIYESEDDDAEPNEEALRQFVEAIKVRPTVNERAALLERLHTINPSLSVAPEDLDKFRDALIKYNELFPKTRAEETEDTISEADKILESAAELQETIVGISRQLREMHAALNAENLSQPEADSPAATMTESTATATESITTDSAVDKLAAISTRIATLRAEHAAVMQAAAEIKESGLVTSTYVDSTQANRLQDALYEKVLRLTARVEDAISTRDAEAAAAERAALKEVASQSSGRRVLALAATAARKVTFGLAKGLVGEAPEHNRKSAKAALAALAASTTDAPDDSVADDTASASSATPSDARSTSGRSTASSQDANPTVQEHEEEDVRQAALAAQTNAIVASTAAKTAAPRADEAEASQTAEPAQTGRRRAQSM